MSQPKAICLNMIVKNEVVNLERCLSSVAGHISCWVIGDTGSTDGTQELIERFFAARGIPGELHRFPFENFAQARNEALDRARASGMHFDYLLMTDADMELRVQNPAFSNNLEAAAYKVLQNSGVAYWNNRLLRRDVPASYRGVTHEYLDVRAGETKSLDGIRFIDHATGSNRVDKYERDARLLTDAIATERDPGMTARYTFYLANTLRDSGQKEAALEMYLNRARQGNWQQEVFMSLLNVAKLKEALESSSDEVIAAYTEANAACPARAEGLHGAARYCRKKRLYEQGYKFASQGLNISYPTQALFVEDWIYAYGLLDELAIHAYWTERYVECLDACERLLSERKLPTDQRDRVLKNKTFAVGKLGEVASPSSQEADSFIKLLCSARRKEELGRTDDEVISAYMEATAACPTRAEALHGAARYCRVKGMHERGYEFAAQGLAIAYPKDALAVENWIYEYGLQQEFSIVANYSRDPARKDRGFASCNWLALHRTVPEEPRNLALSNLHFYIEPAAKMMPSFAARPVGFAPPDGYRPMNPSIACQGDEIVLVLRTVNYAIDLPMAGSDDWPYATPDGAPVNTRNFLLRMDGDLAIRSSTEILPPEGMPKPVWPLAHGFEDLRPFAWRDGLWCIACLRELSHEGWCEQVLARIDERTPAGSRLADWRVLRPAGPRRHEKNWMPRVAGDTLQFIYLCDPTRLVDEQARTVAETIPPIAVDQFRGGSQAITFDGGWLALVHETRVRDKQRHYRHRFVWFDEASQLRRVSRPFFFHKSGVEFAAGLACHPAGRRLVLTYGIEDCEAWIATVDADDVRGILEDAEKLPSGKLGQLALRQVIRTHSEVHAPVFASADIPEPSIGTSYDEAGRRHNRSDSSVGKKTDISSGNPVAAPNGQAEPPDTHHRKIRGFSERPESYDRIKYWLKGEPIQNFGDFLTELLLEKLFVGDPVKARHIHLIGSVVSDPFVDLKHDEAVSGNALDVEKVIFWGCGLRSDNSLSQHLRENVEFLAVRGPLTQKALDLPDTTPIGDPGLLLPAVYQPRVLRKFLSKSVCIPHFSDRRNDSELLRLSGCDLLLRTNIENSITAIFDFVDSIATADFVLSASLHGAIAAAAYGKPFAFWDNGFLDCPFKWRDFAASTNIQCRWFTSLDQAMDFFNAEIAPNLNIPVLLPLLLNAPLPVRQDALAKVIAADIDRHGSDVFDFEIGLDDPSSMRISRKATFAPQQRKEITNNGGESLERTIGFIDAAFIHTRRNETSLASPGADAHAENPQPKTSGRMRQASSIENGAAKSPKEKFLSFAPFLHATESPKDRRDLSRAFDARIAPFIRDRAAALPQIHCFYEVMSKTEKHESLIAANQSMRAAGHPVRVWSYAPAKLEFLAQYGVELRDAADVVPKSLFERIVARSEIRYFSDIFRYAVLYEYGGLWMDTDVVMLYPFPFRGDYFFNLQWQHAGRGHFVCGNVIYAKPYDRHMRALYEQALERFFAAPNTTFGDIGPNLLSDYIASDEGADLQEWLFSPMFFNSLDWTEVDRFNQPIDTLADYLNDERVTGIHLWNARTHSAARDADRSLIATLSAPYERMPSFTGLADRFNTDKNRHTGNRHCYARIYDRLLGAQRFALRRLMEIGLCRGLAEKNQPETPSVALWQSYFPFCHVVGVDLTDFSSLNNARFTSFVCDQSKRDELRAVVAKLVPGSFDVIIDDGSHASADQQLTLVEFFSLLADGGWYFIEDLDWQPPGEDSSKIALTKTLLSEIQEHGVACSIDPFGVTGLADQFADILFFDSHYELSRARLMGGLVAIRKTGGGNG